MRAETSALRSRSSRPRASGWMDGAGNGDNRFIRRTQRGAAMTTALPSAVADLLPSADPIALIAPDGSRTGRDDPPLPEPDVLRELHRRMVVGRRLDAQCTALTKQGRLAVYPSSRGQEACQIGAVLALREQDWLFPTYRDSVAVLQRGV